VKVDKAILSEIILEEVDALIESGELDEGYWDTVKSRARSTLGKDSWKSLGYDALAGTLGAVGLDKAAGEAESKHRAANQKIWNQEQLDMMMVAIKAVNRAKIEFFDDLRTMRMAYKGTEPKGTEHWEDGLDPNKTYIKDRSPGDLGEYIKGYAALLVKTEKSMVVQYEEAKEIAGREGKLDSGTGIFKDQEEAPEPDTHSRPFPELVQVDWDQ